MANWRAAGPDLVQGYWFKMIHTRLQEYMQDSICQGNVPEWMIIGRRVLIQKDPAKVNQASNYRPIACLPIIWKLLTEIMGEKLYRHLERDRLLVLLSANFSFERPWIPRRRNIIYHTELYEH